MSFSEAIGSGFRNIFRWSGRASRSAFWWFYLFLIIVFGATYLTERHLLGSDATDLITVVSLILFLPIVSVSIRRLHDWNRSGWWVLLGIVPLLGSLLLLLMMLPNSSSEPNEWGPDPEGKVSFSSYSQEVIK